ncbi:MAG: hypothetical protein A2X02_09035 [Bacteroidetes bacterium GWF2_29_10]|nr:MAG: hypothetical protein A2X02_09035 [Bacteroidetes bacterium GWF2_29_10]
MKKIYLLIFVLISTINIFAQVEFTATCKSPVAQGEQFRLVLTLNAKGSGFQAPSMSDFNVLSGPSTSSSSSISIVNGNVSQSVSTTYTYIISAAKEGDFKIGSASIEVEGKRYISNPITVKVLKSSAYQQQYNSQSSGSNRKNNEATGKAGTNLVAMTSINRSTVYQGEPIVATSKIYSRLNLVGFNNVKFPTYDGFWSEELKMPSEITLRNEQLNGISYKSADLKKMLLFPQKSGTIKITPIEIECVVREVVRDDDPFSAFGFFNSQRNVKYNVVSNAVNINVLPLPERNKPIDFTGAVGQFKIKSTIDKTKAKTNDGISFKLIVSGSGNFKLINKFDIQFPADIEVYDPKVSENVSTTEKGMNGTKVFEYLLIPRSAGKFTIPSVTFNYFDPQKKDYVNIASEEFEIEIEKGKGDASGYISSINKEDLKYLGKDIRYIKTANITLKPINTQFLFSTQFYILSILPLFLFLLFIILLNKKIKENRDIALVKNKRATKIAKKRLKTANKFLQENNSAEFYNEVSKALEGYIGDKLNISISELNKDNIIASLSKRNVQDEYINKLIELLNECEFARFAPQTSSETLHNTFDKASELIMNLEQKIKR